MNGNRLSPNSKHLLHENDSIRVGSLKFKFKIPYTSAVARPLVSTALTEHRDVKNIQPITTIIKRSPNLKSCENDEPHIKIQRNPFAMCPNLEKNLVTNRLTNQLTAANGGDSVSNVKLVNKVDELQKQIGNLVEENRELQQKNAQLDRKLALSSFLISKKRTKITKLTMFAKNRVNKIKTLRSQLKQTREKRDHFNERRKELSIRYKQIKRRLKELEKKLNKAIDAVKSSNDQKSSSSSSSTELIVETKRLDDILNEDLICRYAWKRMFN